MAAHRLRNTVLWSLFFPFFLTLILWCYDITSASQQRQHQRQQQRRQQQQQQQEQLKERCAVNNLNDFGLIETVNFQFYNF